MYKRIFKRCSDLFIALLGLIILSPVFILLSVLLLIQNKGNPFFLQKRPGKDQEPFYIIKFKSMTDKKDNSGKLLPDRERLTALGKIIRTLSLDELPQLINVVKGDMSLVGPRPLLFKYIPLFSEEQLRRHEVRPGITGLAQVKGRNSISWSKKFEWDVYYIDHLTLKMDMKIFLMTIKKVLLREGVNQSSGRPMQPFNGNN